jgi:hypothetical protein
MRKQGTKLTILNEPLPMLFTLCLCASVPLCLKMIQIKEPTR